MPESPIIYTIIQAHLPALQRLQIQYPSRRTPRRRACFRMSRYGLATTRFRFAKPSSNFVPTILSQFMKSPAAFPMKLFLPEM